MVGKLLGKLKRFQLIEPLFYITKSKNVKRYREIRKQLEKKDKLYAENHPKVVPLHERLNELRQKQMEEWGSIVYCDGYFYQGFDKIGISGIKPTEQRIRNYGIQNYFDAGKSVLDIGSNSGFLVCYLAEYFDEVEGIELNPYLVKMGEATKKFLGLENVKFIRENFIKHNFEKKYDIIFSLSNHHTVDGNLNINFERYIKKIYQTLEDNGILFFESHDIDGGDADLAEKFKIASKYFELINHKMVEAFYDVDIDKLFAIFRRKNEKSEIESLDFSLEKARRKYHY